MSDHRCNHCGNPDVIKLSTCLLELQQGLGYVHCPDCHHDTPWLLSQGQNHLVCCNRADRRYPKESPA